MTVPAALTLSVSFFTAAVFIHLLICTYTGGNKFMQKGLLTGLAVTAAAAVWQYSTGPLDPVSLYLVITLWLAYLIFLINLLNSVTLKMLARLAQEPSGALDEEAFRNLFNEETGIKLRLEDMRANGFIRQDGENLRLTEKAGLLLRTVFLIRKILSIDVVG